MGPTRDLSVFLAKVEQVKFLNFTLGYFKTQGQATSAMEGEQKMGKRTNKSELGKESSLNSYY